MRSLPSLFRCFSGHPRMRDFTRMLEPLRETRCPACAAPVPFAAAGGAESGPDRSMEDGMPPLCPSCAASLARRERGFCVHCGELFSTNLPTAVCGKCLAAPRPWGAFFFHGAYQGLLRDLLLRFKNGRELALGALLGGFLANHPGITGPYDALVPIPLHPERLRERGFNQSLEAARPLAGRLGVPIEHRLLSRARHTIPQAGQSLEARRDNVRGVFRASSLARNRRVLLVDDVATTCATLESATRVLLDAGAASVDAAAIARTPDYTRL